MAAPNLIQTLQQAGFRGPALRTAWAIAMRESGGNPAAFNGNAGTGDKSYGLFQVNMLGGLGPARLRQYGLPSENALFDPTTNAKVAFQMSHGGTDFGAWGLGANAYKGAPSSAVPRFQQWYAKYPGAAGGGSPSFASAQLPSGGGSSAAPAPGGGNDSRFVQSLLATTSQILGTPAPTLPAVQPSSPMTVQPRIAAAPVAPQTSVTPGKIALPIRGVIGQESPQFLAELTAAAKARGAVAIVATSGERSVQHNQAVGGAQHSNHLPDAQGYGHALDGYAVLRDGSRVPLGTFLRPNATAFGLRSGATFNWGGSPDVVHVDDFANGGR